MVVPAFLAPLIGHLSDKVKSRWFIMVETFTVRKRQKQIYSPHYVLDRASSD